MPVPCWLAGRVEMVYIVGEVRDWKSRGRCESLQRDHSPFSSDHVRSQEAAGPS